MTIDKTPKDNPAELSENDLDEVYGGASKKQHKPVSLAKPTPTAEINGNPGKYNLGGDFAP